MVNKDTAVKVTGTKLVVPDRTVNGTLEVTVSIFVVILGTYEVVVWSDSEMETTVVVV